MKDIGLWTIFKVVLNHSHPCCPSQAEMLKQHRELTMFVHHTIETHEKAGIRPSKTYQSFVVAAGSHRELGFIEIDVRNYITRKVQNIFEEDDAKEFGKYLVRMKEKNKNFLFEINLEGDHYIKHAFWADARNMAAFDYFRDVAGMRSTQRSESMHSFLNKFITRNSTLRQFVKQYDNCLASREQAERELDAADFHTVIPCTTKSAIEAQFHHVYTHEKFREVQAQFRGKVSCITRSMHSTLGFTTYEVIEQVSNSTFNKFVVTYDAESQDVKCHCLLFESRGILCRHSLSVLSFERVDNVAPKYILEC
nr:protein FAR1-RELATED SEQUENCE 5-like [Arachis hypogaea]